MRNTYKKLGAYIQQINERNTDLKVERLLGVSIRKVLMPSIANTVGTNMKNYKIIRKNQFAYGPVTSRNGDKISIALLENYQEAIISQSYKVFEIIDISKLLPEYLMMWFRRPEFDRYARFMSHGSTRETFDWEEMCDVELPIPSWEKQQEIVDEYNTVENRIKLNEQINQKLEETAQALYKHWFVDFEFPDHLSGILSEVKGYKSSGGKMVYNQELDKEIPEGWKVDRIDNSSNLKYGKMLNPELFLDRGYPVYSGYGIRGYYDKYMYELPQILVICRGVSGTGKVRMSPAFAYITNLSIIVENHQELTTKEYLFYYLKNDNLRSLDSGSAQSQITTGDLGFYKVLIPNLNIQELFAKYITKIKSLGDIDKTSKLEELKLLLLSKMTRVEQNAMT